MEYQIAAHAHVNNTNKKVIFKNCPPFTDFISEINNTRLDLNITILIYNLIEYSDNYAKTSESLYQYCRDEPALDNNGNNVNFTNHNATDLNLKKK